MSSQNVPLNQKINELITHFILLIAYRMCYGDYAMYAL